MSPDGDTEKLPKGIDFGSDARAIENLEILIAAYPHDSTTVSFYHPLTLQPPINWNVESRSPS